MEIGLVNASRCQLFLLYHNGTVIDSWAPYSAIGVGELVVVVAIVIAN